MTEKCSNPKCKKEFGRNWGYNKGKKYCRSCLLQLRKKEENERLKDQTPQAHVKKNSFQKFMTLALFIIIIFFVGRNLMSDSSNDSDSIKKSSEKVVVEKTIEFIDSNYDDLWSVFSPSSKYTDLQKEKIFNEEYKGKYVEWTGTVKDVDTSILDSLILYVAQRDKGLYDFDGGDLVIYMNKDQYDNLIEVSKGDTIIYSGKFTSFGEIVYVTFYLSDGRINN